MSLLLDMLEESEEQKEKPFCPSDGPSVTDRSAVFLEKSAPVSSLDLVLIEDEEPEKVHFDTSSAWIDPEPDLEEAVDEALSSPAQESAFPVLFPPGASIMRSDAPAVDDDSASDGSEQAQSPPVLVSLPPQEPVVATPVRPVQIASARRPVLAGENRSASSGARKMSFLQGEKRFWWLGGGVALVCGLGVGGYFFYQSMLDEPSLMADSRREGRPQRVVQKAPPVADTSSQAHQQAVKPTAPDAQNTPPSPVEAPSPSGAAASAAEVPASASVEHVEPAVKPSQSPEASLSASPVAPVAVPERVTEKSLETGHGKDAPLAKKNEPNQMPEMESPPAASLFTKSAPKAPDIKAGLRSGRTAFMKGDLATARKQFEQVLRHEPHNHAAMAGLASIAIRENRNEQARAIYQEILRENPRDSLASAGLISLTGSADLVWTVSQLQQLLHDAPNEAHLHFVLGNLYVEQKNWPEAEQSFFNAYRLDPDNPDVLLNLAVSLDQMGKEQVALPFYRKALQFMEWRGGAGFDKGSVQRRITILDQRFKEP